MTKTTIKQILVTFFNLLLTGLLGYNLFRLFVLHQKVQEQLDGNILSSNPELFIRQISQQDVSWWVWVVNVLALVITLFFLIRPLISGLKANANLHRLNLIWLVLWLVYLVTIIILTVVALASIFV